MLSKSTCQPSRNYPPDARLWVGYRVSSREGVGFGASLRTPTYKTELWHATLDRSRTSSEDVFDQIYYIGDIDAAITIGITDVKW